MSTSKTSARPIGLQVTVTYCLDCIPDGLDGCDLMCEGDDAGIPYGCDQCGRDLAPRSDDE